MALIEIDDRDVFNYFTAAPKMAQEQLKQWLMELKANNLTAKIISLGNGVYQLDLPVITCTGSTVDTRFNIPHMHKLLRVSIKHTDSSNIDSVDVMTYSLSKRQHPNLWVPLLYIGVTTASDIMDEYIDYFMELGEYLIQSNTTNTDRLYIQVIIKITGA
ncbi:MAG: hypothetical protein KAJ19_10665 [Gammaproteobacteria bacterium]|nr:hypothetical protein [Gammaproteobacteria bacterium]